MVLSDKGILRAMRKKEIVIRPFRRDCLGSNSYDVHLSKYLSVYKDKVLDAKKKHELKEFEIGEKGFVLQPGELYLSSTEEYTESHKHIPFLEGKSSIGRLGIDIHATAGKGDVGFCNHWTLEMSVKKPVRVYAGMPIAQLIYFKPVGKVLVPYTKKKGGARYVERDVRPQASRMWKNFPDMKV